MYGCISNQCFSCHELREQRVFYHPLPCGVFRYDGKTGSIPGVQSSLIFMVPSPTKNKTDSRATSSGRGECYGLSAQSLKSYTCGLCGGP